MKILVYGEYSGYGNSLAAGFKELGYEASVFSPNGDGWKNLNSDISLSSSSKIGRLLELFSIVPKFLKFDVVYIMNPTFFNFKLLGPLILLLLKIKKIKIYLLCCGDDVEYIKAGESGALEKFVFNGIKYPSVNYFKTVEDKVVNYLCAKAALKIIPTMYDYELPWKLSGFSNKVTKVIPLACHLDAISKLRKTNFNSIKIMHGINRRDVKGTDYILSALKRIEEEFKNVTVYTPEKMSQSDYLRLFSEIDISIDQCKCHSYGMNAIYAMLHGHVVLAPADIHHCKSLGIPTSPVISISASEDAIYEAVRKVLIEKDKLDSLKYDCYVHARMLHSPVNVCKKLISEL
ncbi:MULTISPECIES: hypothetical protein [Aeromonas]|uniref:hypothetical protein n=1 Tax=Aeromonas TaxID=642 RepID=UPI000AD794D3|nr:MULTISPECIES: hypothetical protein [Aeromonas]MCX4036050.1 hypothetical protein [Aeromonas caviae]